MSGIPLQYFNGVCGPPQSILLCMCSVGHLCLRTPLYGPRRPPCNTHTHTFLGLTGRMFGLGIGRKSHQRSCRAPFKEFQVNVGLMEGRFRVDMITEQMGLKKCQYVFEVYQDYDTIALVGMWKQNIGNYSGTYSTQDHGNYCVPSRGFIL